MTSIKLSFSPFGSIGGYPSSYQAFFIRSLFNFFTFTRYFYLPFLLFV